MLRRWTMLGGWPSSQLAAVFGLVTPEQASVWRETGTYPADRRIPGDPETATPEFVADIAKTATSLVRACLGLITEELDTQPPTAELALVQCKRIEDELARIGG